MARTGTSGADLGTSQQSDFHLALSVQDACREIHAQELLPESGVQRTMQESPRGGRGGGRSQPFGGLHRGFLLQSSKPQASPKVPGRSICTGYLRGSSTLLHLDTILKALEPANKLAMVGTFIQPPRQQEDSECPQGSQSSKVKLKCKNVLKLQQCLWEHLNQLKSMDWCHPDVEAVLNQHPRLSRQMGNPHFAHTLKRFHEDPERFMQHFEENDEEIIFIKDLLEIIGELLHRQSSQTAAKGFDQTLGISCEDAEKLNHIAEHPDIKEAISDPGFRHTLREMSQDPGQAERVLECQDAGFRAGMATLVAAGVMDILLGPRASGSA
ncbi:uncharacterized protein [Narcine bancroftii]|uniref:uncharacterized protein isoform X1 n=1 Tax=Narcine bancroftii TaxID=1343680 RepID=UPI0038321102